jgi:FHA domain
VRLDPAAASTEESTVASAKKTVAPKRPKQKAKAKAAQQTKTAHPHPHPLLAEVAARLGVGPEQAVAMAVGELAARLGITDKPESQPPPKPQQQAASSLPQRLFLALDGRGLDGLGLPVEVIDLPCILGSSKACTVWVNSPQIETRHCQITRGDEGWILEDLGSTHGTYFEGHKVGRRVLQHGDLFLLANYLRVRVELR